MNTLDIVIIAVVCIWFIAAVISLLRRKTAGCCGVCTGDCRKCAGCAGKHRD